MEYTAGNSQNHIKRDANRGMNQVKLVQQDPLKINGDVTGRIYEFKKMNDIIWVDKRDLMGMKTIKGLQLFF
ncbi:MAG: hypothetical protein H0W84_00190 [Bacteroidetes bacterium]|nr:hypothetical protein [Bacteroidota bacterium]